jgi:hypothetical protein
LVNDQSSYPRNATGFLLRQRIIFDVCGRIATSRRHYRQEAVISINNSYIKWLQTESALDARRPAAGVGNQATPQELYLGLRRESADNARPRMIAEYTEIPAQFAVHLV